jgi:hypothetical protein
MSEITISGPLFDGTAADMLAELVQDALWSVGMAAESLWLENLDTNLVTQTPYYITQITIERLEGAGPIPDVVVHDRGVIYGPWLEGVSSRNDTTRFKGYASLRAAAQAIEDQVDDLVADAVERGVARMNGEN